MADDVFDVLVIGAGPAGSAAAVTAARAGLAVALIDKAAFPRDKLCGGLVTGRARKVLARVFGAGLDPELFDENRRICFRFRGEPLAEMAEIPPVWTTMRRDMDAWLREMAVAAGARDMTGHRIAALDAGGPAVTLANGRVLRGAVMIGADGVNSPVAKALFGAAYDRQTIGLALEVEADGPHLQPGGPIRVDFAAVEGGYGWSFPKRRSTTVGVGGPQAQNPGMKAAMAGYMKALGIAPGAYAVKGHFLPVGDFRAVPGRGAVLLAGDAAGLVDPVTGEGIAHAMESGHFAALSAAEALARGAPASALAFYRPKLREIHAALRMARQIRPVFYAGFLQPVFAGSFRNSATLRRMYLEVLSGDLEYPDLHRAVLRRLPRLALRAGRAALSARSGPRGA